MFLLSASTWAQQKRKVRYEPVPPPQKVFYVGESAHFAGDLEDYIRKNLWYSRDAYIESHPGKQKEKSDCETFSFIPKEAPTGGELPVCFLVETDGPVTQIKLGKSLNPVLDAAVLQMVRRMPLWKPARRQGIPVMEQVNIVVKIPPLSN